MQQVITKVEIPGCHSSSVQPQAEGEAQAQLRLQEWTGHSQPFGKMWALLSSFSESSPGINSIAQKLPQSVFTQKMGTAKPVSIAV